MYSKIRQEQFIWEIIWLIIESLFEGGREHV